MAGIPKKTPGLNHPRTTTKGENAPGSYWGRETPRTLGEKTQLGGEKPKTGPILARNPNPPQKRTRPRKKPKKKAQRKN